MNFPKNTLTLLIIFLIILCSLFFNLKGPKEIEASPGFGGNITGWAWSENIGWISFNCYNDYNGDGVLEDHCSSSTYGVNLNTQTKVFSGYAWSENIGWITFKESELSGCPSSPCRAWLGTDNKVYGWARALAFGGGWDGWIHLSGTTTTGLPYGVTFNPSTSEFESFAWSDMVIGWTSFNCKDGGYNEGTGQHYNVCATSSYRVYLISSNQPPSATNLQQTPQYCNVSPGVGKLNFNWTYNDPEGTDQSAYSLEVQQLIGGSWQTKVFCENVSTLGPPSGGIGTSAVYVNKDPPIDPSICASSTYIGNIIEYGKSTLWKIKVRDGDGNWSDWTSSASFSIDSHAHPWIDFSWTPQRPNVEQVVKFNDLSKCYNSTGNVVPCASWYWTFQDGNPSTSTIQNPTTTFISIGSKEVDLKVTDSDGFYCIDSKNVPIGFPLPFWKEIIPW